MTNSNDNVKLIGALLLGAAVGGALGILLAPDKGSETRKKILAKSDDLTDSLKEKFTEAEWNNYQSLIEESKGCSVPACVKNKELRTCRSMHQHHK